MAVNAPATDPESDPGKSVPPKTLRLGSAVHLWKDRENPVSAFKTRVALAALSCGFDLISDKGFQHSLDGEAETPADLAASRSVTWLWDADKKATFRPAFAEETIDIAEFERRFSSLEWCAKNPDHPISYMRTFLEKSRQGMAIISHMAPTLRYRRGDAVVVAPPDATPEDVEGYFAELDNLKTT